MKVELEIRQIIKTHNSPEARANLICNLMIWNKKEVLDYFYSGKTLDSKGKFDYDKFFDKFWNKNK